ncbi:MAG: TonB-dependent receptor plug domain-containing protein [Thermodesulfobacteriota bacterium]
MEPVVVTATRLEEPVSSIPASATVITEEEMERKGAVTVGEAIRDAPGIYMRRSGTIGASTSTRIRGADVTQTLVLIDGVEVNNSWTGFYDWANLMVDNVERVEVVRNPQSALYGSEAMGGVINIITKKGEGFPTATVSTEGGSFDTYREVASLAGKWGIANFATSVSRLDSDGQFTNDDYRNTTLSGRLGLDIAERASVTWTSRYIDAVKGLAINPNEFWLMTNPPPFPFLRDDNRDRENAFFLNIVDLRCEVFPWWDFSVRGSSVNDDELVEDQFTPGIDLIPGMVPLLGMTIDTDSERYTFGSQQNLHLLDEMMTVIGGLEYEKEGAVSKAIFEPETPPLLPTRVDKDRINRALYLQGRFDYEGFTFIAGVRYDDDSIFGNKTNPKLSGSYLFDKTHTRVKSSWGTGFRAPTFEELFNPFFGNPDLGPEESTSFEFGVDQRVWQDKLFLEAAYFYTRYKDLIQPSPLGVSNIGKAKIWGIEAGVSVKPIKGLELRGNVTYLDTEDEETHEELTRRPRYVWYLNANYRWNQRLTLNLDANIVTSVRSDFDAISPDGRFLLGRNPGYEKVDVAASYKLLHKWTLLKGLTVFGRIENLLDEEYQEAKGFPAPGFNFLIGLRASL